MSKMPPPFKLIECVKLGDAYRSGPRYTYYSERYGKSISVPANYPSNGANYVEDLHPTAFFVHDRGCEHGYWDDGSKMCNLELSFVYYDILVTCGTPRWRAAIRWAGTFLRGGGQARKHGLWRVKNV